MTIRFYNDVLRTMRLAISRRNPNDPDSSDATLGQYINDAYALTMSDDVKLFEQFGTLEFEIDETNTTGVYDFPGPDTSFNFRNLSSEALISLTNPIDNSVSWSYLQVYEDPGEFFYYWGFNNDQVLIPGFPTQVLYYDTQLTFRTIPNTSYIVRFFGYKSNSDFDLSGDGNPALPSPEWMRYIAYLAAKNYAQDYNFSSEMAASINAGYQREKSLMMNHMHNQIKIQRSLPRF